MAAQPVRSFPDGRRRISRDLFVDILRLIDEGGRRPITERVSVRSVTRPGKNQARRRGEPASAFSDTGPRLGTAKWGTKSSASTRIVM